MKGTLLTLAFIALGGTAGAQIAPAAENETVAPNVANAPMSLEAAAATAKKRIEMDGYTDVRGLAKGPDGLWQATALRGNTSVQVTVDRSGNVAAK